MENGELQSKLREARRKVLDHHKAKSQLEKEDTLSAAQSAALQSVGKRKAVLFKASHGLSLGFLTLVAILHVLGIYLFATGFLLTRLVLDKHSECSVPPTDLLSSVVLGSHATGCWHPKTFDKAVVVIVDALRYDFTVPFQSADPDTPRRHFHDALTFFYETAVQQPNNAVLRPFIADPPTTTLQRLKGLTTGSLPTFVDAGSNFGGDAIEEDNIIAQLRASGKTIVHLGDDTWTDLFPGHFDAELTRPYPSLIVHDLHTVDNGVTDHLLPYMHPSNRTTWDVIFGHYLGVDHAGHIFGPDHHTTHAKLKQMDAVFRQVVDLLDDETLLVVMGDHGMDSSGNHGGESDDELEAALWLYSKKGFFGHRSEESRIPPPTAKERQTLQIDLVPTLSLLLGLPIPVGNLGMPIEEAFLGPAGTDFENLARVNRITAAQVKNFQEDYALIRKPEEGQFAVPDLLWDAATRQLETRLASSPLQAHHWESIAGAFAAYRNHTLAVFKELWARFDFINIALGIAVIFASLLTLAIYARGLAGDVGEAHPILLTRGAIGLASGALTGAVLGLLFPKLGLNRLMTSLAALESCVALLWTLLSFPKYKLLLLPSDVWSWVCVISTTLLSVGFAANSFTIWEDEIHLFFLAVFGTLIATQCLRLASSRDQIHGLYHAFIFLAMVRLASLSRLCREEQLPICKSSYFASSSTTTSAPWQLAISYIIAIVLPATIKAFYQHTQSYHGSAPFWISIAFRTSLFITAVVWTLDSANSGDWVDVKAVSRGWIKLDKEAMELVRRSLAQLVLMISAGAGTATFVYQAPFIVIETVAPGQSSEPEQSPVVASSSTSLRQVKAAEHLSSQTTDLSAQTRPQLLVHGVNNLYGSHFAMLPLTVLLPPLLLFQKPMGQAALAFTAIAILSLLELLHLLRQPQKQSLQTRPSQSPPLSYTSALGPTVLAFLGHFAYFKTGHQATIQSIQWDAAFIPLATLRYPWSPFFMVLNTFAGQLLCAAAVPACVLWRRGYNFGMASDAPSAPSGSKLLRGSDAATAAPEFPSGDARRDYERRSLLSDATRAVATHLLVYATINAFTTVWAAHLRRHLMLYRVFMPRWMFGGGALFAVDVVGVWVGLGGVSWTVSAVGAMLGW